MYIFLNLGSGNHGNMKTQGITTVETSFVKLNGFY